MTKLSDFAKDYEAPKTKNIADLEVVRTDQEIIERVFKEGTLEEFKVNVIVTNEEDYRVPMSVVKSLKVILEAKPDLAAFKVTKTGEGLKTEYTVIPL